MSEDVSQGSAMAALGDFGRQVQKADTDRRKARERVAQREQTLKASQTSLSVNELNLAKNEETLKELAAAVEAERAGVEAQRNDVAQQLSALATDRKVSAKAEKKHAKITEALRLLSEAFADDDDDEDEDDIPVEEVAAVESQAEDDESEPEVIAAAPEPEPEPVPQPAPTPPPAPPASPKPVVAAKPKIGARARPPRATLTVPERVAAAMGTGEWDTATLEPVVLKMGGEFKTKPGNLRSYLSGIFSQTRIRVQGPDGKDLRKDDGTLVEVKLFIKLDRGRYRVATQDEIQREARKILGSEEAIISQSALTHIDAAGRNSVVDELFAEQGIHLGNAIPPAP